MKHTGRWILAVAAVAISGWAGLHALPDHASAAIGEPSAAANNAPTRAVGRTTLVQRTDTTHALPKQDWIARFHAAGSNYFFDFVELAAPAAFAGDGAAQYYIGRTLARCEETNTLYQDAEDVDEAVSYLAYAPALLELERREYLGCDRFRSENPFKALPERAGGYPAEYWRSRALQSGYPVAVVAAALGSADRHAPQLIATALASGNPEAMLLFGWTKATASGATGPAAIMAAAWVLAACDGGANCGPTNDVLPSSNCGTGTELGCTERYTVVDELTASLTPEELDQAHLLARNIQADLRDRDPAKLRKYLPL